MKISVALCTFNGEQFLKAQLSSIQNQTLLPFELIICDDHSTDKTIEIINSFITACPFPVRVIHNPSNIGSTKNFEKAVRLCQGDIIAFADQDDIWKPRKLEVISQAFLVHPEIYYVFTNAELVDAELISLGRDLWKTVGFSKKEYQKFIKGEQFEVLVKRNVVTGTTMAFKADLKDFVLPFSANWVHDGWIALLASVIGMKGEPIAESLVFYRQHTNQQQGEYRENIWEVIDKSIKLSAGDFEKLALACYEIKERILTRHPRLNDVQQRRIELLKRKEAHFLNRKSIHSSLGFLKYKAILHEISTRNYQYFSCGWLSALRDMLS